MDYSKLTAVANLFSKLADVDHSKLSPRIRYIVEKALPILGEQVLRAINNSFQAEPYPAEGATFMEIKGKSIKQTFTTIARKTGGKWVVDLASSGLDPKLAGTLIDDSVIGAEIAELVKSFNAMVSGLIQDDLNGIKEEHLILGNEDTSISNTVYIEDNIPHFIIEF